VRTGLVAYLRLLRLHVDPPTSQISLRTYQPLRPKPRSFHVRNQNPNCTQLHTLQTRRLDTCLALPRRTAIRLLQHNVSLDAAPPPPPEIATPKKLSRPQPYGVNYKPGISSPIPNFLCAKGVRVEPPGMKLSLRERIRVLGRERLS
jgi:hypothetical protein